MTQTPRTPAIRKGLAALGMLMIGVMLGGCPSGDAPETVPGAAEDATAIDAAPEEAGSPIADAPPAEVDVAVEAGGSEPPAAELPIEDPMEEIDDADDASAEDATEKTGLDFATRVDQYVSIEKAVSIEEWEGALVHGATGMSFPKSVAGWARLGSKRYDADGYDVGIGYTRMWRSAIATVTVFVYPREVAGTGSSNETAETHLDAVLAAVRDRHDDVEERGRATGTATLRGTSVTFASAEVEHRGGPEHFGRQIAGISSAVTAQAWWIKLRVTTPVENRDTALAAVEELLAELGLPGTGLPASAPPESAATNDD